MKTFQKLIASICLALFVASFAACGADTSEIKTVDEADRNLPPAATGDGAGEDDGAQTSFE